MGDLVQVLSQALAIGAVYACISVGFSLIFAASKVAQFGAGNMVVLGGTMFAMVQDHLGGVLALVVCTGAGAVLGALVYLGVIQVGQRMGGTPIALSIAALAVGLMIDALTGLWTGGVPQVADPLLRGSLSVGGATFPRHLVVVVLVVAMVLAASWAVLFRSLLGKSMLAVSYRPMVAVVSGVSVRWVTATAWIGATALMMLAGALLVPISVVTRDAALPLAVAGFAAAIIGGIGSFQGAVSGAFVVALAQTVFARYVSSAYVEVLVFTMLFLLLVVRPSGLFGVGAVRRA